MTRYVDRLEEELLRAGFGRRERMRRAWRPSTIVALALVGAVVAVTAVRPGAEREREATTEPHWAPCSGRATPSSVAVDGRLLALLASLRSAPPAQQSTGAAACAERTVVAGGPANAGASRWVAPGVVGGDVYLVPVVHWGPAAGAMSAAAKARFALPGACLVTVGPVRFDAAGQCFSVEQIADGDAVATAEVTEPAAEELGRAGVEAALRRGSYVSLLVPDGVASVELRYDDGTAVREQVVNNTVIAHSTRSAPAAMPASVVSYDVAGRACARHCN